MTIVRSIFAAAITLALAACSPAPTDGQRPQESTVESSNGRHWVTAQYLDRHTCPSDRCGVVGRLSFREAATPIERRDGWVRISRVYDASCRNGRSQYVDEGNADCSADNGIVDGQFAEWVREDSLAAERPADPAETATVDEALIANSDDFTQYRRAFVTATQSLLADGRCSAADFEEMGGWLKATMERRNEPVYFTYCGGMTIANRLYLNVETGEIFR
jgi:hypothetical protein